MKEVGEGEEQDREGRREGENVQKHRGVGGTECSGEREKREGEVKDRGREHEEEAEEEGGRWRREGRREGGRRRRRERSAHARWFPTKQVRLHNSHD